MAESIICLVMIVKDEAAIIEECLSSVASFIDYWVICDTGSSDATPEIVKSFFAQKQIPGELHHHNWENFGANRTRAMAVAADKATYSLVMDADDVFEGRLEKAGLTADCYLMPMQLSESCSFWRAQLFRNTKAWRYEGVLHEYPVCEGDYVQARYEGTGLIQARSRGARSLNPNKYFEDALLLLQALQDEPENARYVFYLAQSFRDAKQPELALKYYRQRAEMGGWQEEVFYSLYMVAVTQQFSLGQSWGDCLAAYLRAFEAGSTRVEPLYQVVRYYRLERQFETALMFGRQALAVLERGTEALLFLDGAVYGWKLLDEVSIAATYAGDAELALRLYDRLLDERLAPVADLERIEKNVRFVVP